MSIELKVKIATLSMEAVYIRRLQRKLARSRSRIKAAIKSDMHRDHVMENQGWLADNLKTNRALYTHRTQDIREEARATHLARMFLKDRPYEEVESFTWLFPEVMWDKIWAMVRKYAPMVPGHNKNQEMWVERFKEWKTAALDHVQSDEACKKRREASLLAPRMVRFRARHEAHAERAARKPTESNP